MDVHTEDKIKFEDDIDSESLKKFTHVKAELYSECCYDGDGMYGDRQQPANGWGCEEPAAVCGVDDSVLTSVLTSDECRSVHYSELKSSGLSICRLCGLKLPDRYVVLEYPCRDVLKHDNILMFNSRFPHHSKSCQDA